MNGPSLLFAATLAMSVTSASDETHVGPIGAVFCETLPSFRSLIAAMLARDEAAAAHLDDCTFLKPGVRVEVLRELALIGSGVRIVAVRVYGNGTSVDGYTLDGNLGDVMPPER